MTEEKTSAQSTSSSSEPMKLDISDTVDITLHDTCIGSKTANLTVRTQLEEQHLHWEPIAGRSRRDCEAAVDSGSPLQCSYNWLRYTALSRYRCLFSFVFLGNLIAFVWVMVRDAKLTHLINAASVNLMAAGLARQPLVINILFLILCAIPREAPLYLRRQCAKVYCYGGVHSACGISSYLWLIGFTILLTRDYVKQPTEIPEDMTLTILTLSYIVLVLLLLLMLAAHPTVRMALHDFFELTHRFCAWSVLILFWTLFILISIQAACRDETPLHLVVIDSPSFWFLILTTISILHPWILLRKVPVEVEPISSHAIRLHFGHRKIHCGQGIALSRSPLRDWHSFATFSDSRSAPARSSATFSCLVSRAGDWTGGIITAPPVFLYTKAVPIYGFAYAMKVFRRIIVVTTGSGIGPCLTYLSDPDRPAIRIIWQARSPLKTYGSRIIDLVHALDTASLIIDSATSRRRADMLPMVLQLVGEFEAEAVCVISNPVMTKKLVFDCESRGVPAFGPIFDS